jgi:DMSO/TMAO reductase YedYZ heme-binding membrane subunit
MAGVLIAAIDGRSLWYLSRGTGVVSLLLLTLTVSIGILTTGSRPPGALPRFVSAGLHRNLSLLAIALLAVHVTSAILDPFASLSVFDVFVPLTAGYRPVWVGLGALALDLLLAVVITSLMRARLGLRRWRQVHWLAYACWPVAFVHALGTGSDVRITWLDCLGAACLLAVTASAAWRLTRLEPRQRAVGAAAGVLGLAVLAAWAVNGPLAAGWAHRAGTPAKLLASRDLQGQVAGWVETARTSAAAPEQVRLALALTGGLSGHLSLRLAGLPTSSGSIAPTTTSARFVPSGGSAAYVGHLRVQAADELVVRVRDARGRGLALVLRLRVVRHRVAGSVDAVRV